MLKSETYFMPVNEVLHCRRTSEIAYLIAKKLKDFKELERTPSQIRRLAYLHDVGKCKISSNILLKRDKLSHAEWHIIKKHPIYSEQILRLIGYSEEDAKMVRYHHEKLDGTGYPDGITKIPLSSQIITVADIYDALTSIRIYRGNIKYNHNEAIAILCSNKAVNQDIVHILDTTIKNISKPTCSFKTSNSLY